MKRIAILSANALRNTVMISVYTDYLLSHKEQYQYDFIYLDKYYEEEETGASHNYRYEYDASSKLGKLKGYLGFIRYSKKILKQNNYDFVIVWGELTATLCYRSLKQSYDKRYCVNIRDLFVGRRASILNSTLFKAIHHASFVSVPTTEYYQELPKDFTNYIQFHSFNDSFMSQTKRKNSLRNGGKIKILYIGNIRFFDYLWDLIEKIQNDSRYELIVAGGGSEPLMKLVKERGINNVLITGKFPKEETPKYLEEADVIYNLYGNEDVNLRMALSNKLYYALYLHLPILVCPNTAMCRITGECGIGYIVEKGKEVEFADHFYNWFKCLNRQEIAKRCDNLISDAKESQKRLIIKLVESINGEVS